MFFLQEGQVAPDNEIGQFISDTVASIPKLSPHTFDKLVNDSLQVYLSSPCLQKVYLLGVARVICDFFNILLFEYDLYHFSLLVSILINVSVGKKLKKV